MRSRKEKAFRLIDERVLGLMALWVEARLTSKDGMPIASQLSAISLKIVIRIIIVIAFKYYLRCIYALSLRVVLVLLQTSGTTTSESTRDFLL